MERAAAEHVRGLIRYGAEVSIYTPKRFLQGPTPEGVRVVDVEWPRWNKGTGRPTFGLAYSIWCRTLASALTQNTNEIDIVHFHGASVGALTRRSPATPPAVLNPHGMEEFGPANLKRLPNRIPLRALARRGKNACIIIATDTALIKAVESNLNVGKDKIHVIPNCVDVRRLDNLVVSPTANTRFTIVTVGRLVNNKGYDLLLGALKSSKLTALLPSDSLWIHYGSGPDSQKLAIAAASHPKVRLEIRKDRSDAEVQQGLASADLFVQPSRYEGSSLTTLEAMTHRRIVVGTAVGGIPDKLREGKTGFLAASASTEEISSAIERAFRANPSVGDAARELVLNTFSSEASDLAYADLYARLISNSQK